MKSTTLIEQTLSLLEPHQKKKGTWIVLLMVFNAVLDFFSIAAFIPLLISILNPGIESRSKLFAKLYSLGGFDSQNEFVIAVTLSVLAFLLLKNIATWWISGVKLKYAFGIRDHIATKAMMHTLNKSYLQFTASDFTRDLHTITSHPLSFANNIILSSCTIVSELLVGILILTCMAYFNVGVFFVVGLILVPVILVSKARRQKLKQISKELKSSYPSMLKDAKEAVEGYVELKAFGKEAHFLDRFIKRSKQLSEIFIKDQMMQAGTLRLTEVLIAVIICSLIIHGVSTNLPYQETLLLLGVYAVASFRIIPSINRIMHSLQHIRTNEHVLSELLITRSPVKIVAPGPRNKVSFRKAIELKNVSFRYPEGGSLKSISITINKGEKIAIIGNSGEGKSTLLLMLLGFLKPDSGELLVDGKVIQDYSISPTTFGYVPQNPVLIHGTIVENIAFGIAAQEVNHERMKQIIIDLDLEKFITTLPDGMQTMVGEKGSKLSGGQRQRLAIARALYSDAEVLILDEVSNHIDSLLEDEIMKILNKLSNSGKTIVMVTHRLNDRDFFDNIFKIRNGELLHVAGRELID